MKEELRLHVKNVPMGIEVDDFKHFFKKFGDIYNVVVKSNYGFFSVKGNPEKLGKLLAAFSNKEWKGCAISVEKSVKESFMERLATERKSVAKEKAPTSVNGSNSTSTLSSTDKKSNLDEPEESVKSGIPKFRGTLPLSTDSNKTSNTSSFDDLWENNVDNLKTSNLQSFLNSKKQSKRIDFLVINTEKEDIKRNVKLEACQRPVTKIDKKKRDDERRLEAIKEKEKILMRRKSLVQSSLCDSSNRKSNKVVFNSDDDECDDYPKVQLFNDQDDNTSEVILPDKNYFNSESGEKLMKLQSQFNNDDRFQLDARFLEDTHDLSGPKINGTLSMVRYDPKNLPVEEEKFEQVKLVGKHKPPPKSSSTEKFYMVSESIKSTIKEKSSEFSLLAAYGSIDVQKVDKKEEIAKPIKRTNPMEIDSSDDEDFERDDPGQIWAPQVIIPSGPRDNFFFSRGDPLLAGAFEFMNKKGSAEANVAAENYDSTRKGLKKIFRDQIMKGKKKTGIFKKKVGGMKKKIFKNHPSKLVHKEKKKSS